MPNIQKRTNGNGDISYRVQIRIKGYPTESATFARLTDAKLWAQQTEADNCHRRCHLSSDRVEFRESLYRRHARLIRE